MGLLSKALELENKFLTLKVKIVPTKLPIQVRRIKKLTSELKKRIDKPNTKINFSKLKTSLIKKLS